jgi:hypothetical protein
MMATTARALAYVVRVYGSLLRDEDIGALCDVAFQLLDSHDKQIARAGVVFARAALAVRSGVVGARLSTFVPLAARWAADPKHHFRRQMRALFERLVARLGYDAIARHVKDGTARCV